MTTRLEALERDLIRISLDDPRTRKLMTVAGISSVIATAARLKPVCSDKDLTASIRRSHSTQTKFLAHMIVEIEIRRREQLTMLNPGVPRPA